MIEVLYKWRGTSIMTSFRWKLTYFTCVRRNKLLNAHVKKAIAKLLAIRKDCDFCH